MFHIQYNQSVLFNIFIHGGLSASNGGSSNQADVVQVKVDPSLVNAADGVESMYDALKGDPVIDSLGIPAVIVELRMAANALETISNEMVVWKEAHRQCRAQT